MTHRLRLTTKLADLPGFALPDGVHQLRYMAMQLQLLQPLRPTETAGATTNTRSLGFLSVVWPGYLCRRFNRQIAPTISLLQIQRNTTFYHDSFYNVQIALQCSRLGIKQRLKVHHTGTYPINEPDIIYTITSNMTTPRRYIFS